MNVALQRLTKWMAWSAALALIAVAILVSVEVILRKVFLIGLNAGTEISSYVLAIVASWGAGFALYERTHVRIDAVTRLMPNRIQVWADLLALTGLMLFAFALTWLSFGTLEDSWRMQSRSMTPLGLHIWIPQALWVFGFAVLGAACIALLVHVVRLIAVGRSDEASGLIGSAKVEDEAVAEAEQALAASREGSL